MNQAFSARLATRMAPGSAPIGRSAIASPLAARICPLRTAATAAKARAAHSTVFSDCRKMESMPGKISDASKPAVIRGARRMRKLFGPKTSISKFKLRKQFAILHAAIPHPPAGKERRLALRQHQRSECPRWLSRRPALDRAHARAPHVDQ